MKVIQFIHPLFLTALGLHAALLFVPIGGEAEPTLIEEDVPLAEITREQPLPADPNNLPVPDLNVSTATKAAGGKLAKPVPTRIPPATVAARATAAPTAALVPNQPPSIVPKTSRGGSLSTNSDASNSTDQSNTDQSSTSQNDANQSDPNAETATTTGTSSAEGSGSSLPLLPGASTASTTDDGSQPDSSGNEPSNSEPSEDVAVADTNESATIGSVLLSDLIASANTQPSPDFEASIDDLVDSLAYDAAGTDNDARQKRLDAWKAELSQQASAGSVESIAPVLNSDNLMEYPLEAALSLEGRSLSVCLEEIPQAAEIGMAFDEQGEPIGKPEIILSTGYEALNKEAITLVTQPENLPADRASKAYLFDVTVDYDERSCVSLEALQE